MPDPLDAHKEKVFQKKIKVSMEQEVKKVASNSIWLLLESIVTMLISLVVGMISARYLGPNNYGLINRFIPYISLANSICTFGMQSIVTREISKADCVETEARTLGSAVRFRFILSGLAIVVINVYALIVSVNEGTLLFFISLAQSISLAFNAYEIFTYWFHAKLKSKYLAISMVATSVLLGVWKIVLLIVKADVIFFAVSTSLQSAVMLVFVLLFFKKEFKPRLKADRGTTRFLIKDSYHLLLTSLGVAIYGQIDKIMIGSALGNAPLGFYTAAYTLATIWYFIPQALSNSLRGVIFASSDDPQAYDKKVRFLYLLTVVLGVIAGIGFQLLGKFCIRILYGAEYLDCYPTLCILGWVGIFANIGTAKSIWLIGKGLQKYTKYFTMMGALLNVVLNFILIRYFGIVGAAIATVASQFCVQIVFPLFFKECRGCVWNLFKCFTAFKYIKQNTKGLFHKK